MLVKNLAHVCGKKRILGSVELVEKGEHKTKFIISTKDQVFLNFI